MATGDITSVVLRADGWSADVTIEGWSSYAGDVFYADRDNRYDFGDVDNASGNVVFTFVDWGYTDGVLVTKTRTVYGTHVVRRPYPNEAIIDETTNGGDLVVRIALSESFYEKSSGELVSGVTGTHPRVSFSASWATVTSPSDTSNSVSNLDCVNNSTRQYPKVIGQWDWDVLRGGWRNITDPVNFDIGFKARHGHNIDKVTLSAIGATSANIVEVDRTTQNYTLANNGLYHECYKTTVAQTNFTQGEIINLRAISYPKIGDANSILDTNDFPLISDRITGKSTCHMVCDKDNLLTINSMAVVDAVNGNNSTGVVGDITAARANPYDNLGEAMNDGAKVVYVKNSGTPLLLGKEGSTPDTDFYVIATEDPEDPGAFLDRGAVGDWNSKYRRNLMGYENIGIRYPGFGQGWLDGENGDRQVLMRNVTLDTVSQPGSVGFGYRSMGMWYVGCSGMGNENLGHGLSVRNAYSVTGCSAQGTGQYGSNCAWTWVANSTEDGNMSMFSKGASNPAPAHNNILIEHNQMFGATQSGTTTAAIYLDEPAQDISIMGNVFEAKSITASGPIIWLFGDGNTSPCENIILDHNTVVGERCNLFYNDQDSAAILRSDIFIRGNAFRSFNIKSDTFSFHPDGNRTGNWEVEYGVNCHDNMYDGSVSTEFTGEYRGINSTFELNNTHNIFGEFGFVDERSSDGTGQGGGDYQPLDGVSILTTRTATGGSMQNDLRGQPNLGTYGAVQLGAGPPPPTKGQVTFNIVTGSDPNDVSPFSGAFDYVIVNNVGDTVSASGSTTAVTGQVDVAAFGMQSGEQYWAIVLDEPSGQCNGVKLTAIEEP